MGEEVVADASGSTDPDVGDVLEFKIDWGDGNVSNWGSATTYTHAYDEPGNYIVTIKVRDGAQLTDGTWVEVRVLEKEDGEDGDDGFIPSVGVAMSLLALLLVGLLRSRRRLL